MVLRADEQRVFRGAVAASLALHALLLLALRLPAAEESLSPSAPTLTVIRLLGPAAEEPREPEKKAARLATREKRASPRPTMIAAQAPSAMVVAHEQAPRPPSDGVREVASAASPAAAAGATRRTPDAGSIARYRQQLIVAAVRYKRYPSRALDEGWEGGAVVRVDIASNGAVDVALKTSSGHAILDDQALEMFRAAAPQVALPPELVGQAFGVDVRAIYTLKD